MAKTYLTKEKAKEIEDELYKLKTKGRKEMAQKIAEARSHGDLSENADYDAAKDAQGLMELKISKLEQTLANAQIIDPSDFPDDKVYILSKVKLLNVNTNDEIEYLLVGAEEADFEQRKISVTSPIGKALMGKKKDEVIELKVPAGTLKYKIIDINK